ncbi:hypothetical protein DPMN_024004 [Dreissena polymorpha]|uniref:Uncharacterized protein n=1 Tax=Dreissena polymorpha TaxID=45954 RepID=A0A9D4RAE1_DREPO|nr:hypothetical protein DPMN_024004 [Dreissena polymorpha]
MLKLAQTNQPTNRPTNQQTGQKQYVPHYYIGANQPTNQQTNRHGKNSMSHTTISPTWTIFKLVRDINETNVLIKFHDDWAIIVTSRVFTRNTAPPPGGHVFQWT